MRVCDSCGEENPDDALVCGDCGEKLIEKNKKTKNNSIINSRKVLLVVIIAVIIFAGIYFTNYFNGDTTIEVDDPEILIESVTINEIERDWLENNTWQVSSTVFFKIINSNDFDIDITEINFSVDLIDDGIPVRIFEGIFAVGLVQAGDSLSSSESFWFLSEDEGIDKLESGNLHFTVNGIALFLAENSSSSQSGAVQFRGEV